MGNVDTAFMHVAMDCSARAFKSHSLLFIYTLHKIVSVSHLSRAFSQVVIMCTNSAIGLVAT